jgi:hypothetical protein
MVINMIQIDLSPNLCWLRQWIQMESCGCQEMCSVIDLSRCWFSYICRCQVFYISNGQTIWIKSWAIRLRRRGLGEQIVPWFSFEYSDWQTSTIGTVFIFHTLQKCLLVVGSIWSSILRPNIYFIVTLVKLTDLLHGTQGVRWNVKYIRVGKNSSTRLWQLLLC